MRPLTCLFGGTFDPVHYGHLKPLAELQSRLAADEVLIIPAARPPHRAPPQASVEQRVAMLRLALQEFPGFRLDTRELERQGPSYTVQTLQALRREQPSASLCLVMGSDAFAGLPTWYHWQDIPELANIIVIERPGAAVAAEQSWARSLLLKDAQQLREWPAGRVLPQCLTRYEISATRLRESFHDQLPVDGKLPDSVIAYIRQHRLYGAGPQ